MSREWYDRVPKSKDREKLLASYTEGVYLGILRKAALRQYKEDASRVAKLQQSSLAEELSTTPGKLRDMESGHRVAPLQVCALYCERMGVPVSILKRVGKGRLSWSGDTPTDRPAQEPPAQPAVKAAPAAKSAAALAREAEDRERAAKARAANRVLNGGDSSVALSKVKNIKVRNNTEWNHVAVLSVTPSGTLIIDIFDDGPAAAPAELCRAGITGVRVALPQTVVYDFDSKKKVSEISVPVEAPGD